MSIVYKQDLQAIIDRAETLKTYPMRCTQSAAQAFHKRVYYLVYRAAELGIINLENLRREGALIEAGSDDTLIAVDFYKSEHGRAVQIFDVSHRRARDAELHLQQLAAHVFNNATKIMNGEVPKHNSKDGWQPAVMADKPKPKISDAIVGPFNATFSHTHNPEIGPDATYHSHNVDVKLTFRADNDAGITFVLNKNTQKILEDIIAKHFESDFTGKTLEEAAQALFARVVESMPKLSDNFNQRAFHLQAVSLRLKYDGSLDHPTQQVEFVCAVG